jgi:hypothetical protein
MKSAFAALVLAVMATAAHAQPGDHLGLGVGIGFQDPHGRGFSSKGPTIVPEYHLGLTPHARHDGLSWGVRGGIGSTNPDRTDFIGGVQTRTGSLRMVPVMVGGGPSYRTGPWKIGVGVVAGPSFNRFSVDDAARAAYHDRTGATLNSIEVENSFAARPDVSVWYNLTSRLGLHGSLGYTVNRPMVKTTVDGVTTSTRWNADKLSGHTGFAVGIF